LYHPTLEVKVDVADKGFRFAVLSITGHIAYLLGDAVAVAPKRPPLEPGAAIEFVVLMSLQVLPASPVTPNTVTKPRTGGVEPDRGSALKMGNCLSRAYASNLGSTVREIVGVGFG